MTLDELLQLDEIEIDSLLQQHNIKPDEFAYLEHDHEFNTLIQSLMLADEQTVNAYIKHGKTSHSFKVARAAQARLRLKLANYVSYAIAQH